MSSMSPIRSVPHFAGASRASSGWRWGRDLLHDRLLLGIVVACALLLGFQLALLLRQPPWIAPAIDGLRAALSWPEVAIVVSVSLWLGRRHRPEALSWWLFSGAALCYAIARTWWTLDDALIYHHGVPFPILPDLFFVLQYPFYFLAVSLFPLDGVWGARLLVTLDALLWMGAAAAVFWYFLLAPLYMASGFSPLAKAVSLGYPIADLFLLLALLLILLRTLRHDEDRPVVGLIAASFACLIVADAGATFLILPPPHEYRTGQFPDFFWLASDLLIPLAAVVQVRVVQRVESAGRAAPEGLERPRLHTLDAVSVRGALRLFLPLVAALLATMAIVLRAAMNARAGATWEQLIVPVLVSVVLLLLVIVRQAVMFLEMARLRQSVLAAQAEQRARRELDRRKDEFLAVVSHEMRTPLTSLEMFLGLVARRPDSPPPREALAYSQHSIHRLARLADDLVDDTRVVHGRLTLRMEPCDLGTIARAAVEEQRAAEPTRAILLHPPVGGQPLPIRADAERIGQVVTNYLTNALKYSAADQPVAVCLAKVRIASGARECIGELGEAGETREEARVSVHDEGIGVPLADQPHVWERFYVVEGTTVQSGSGTSLGLGLYVCKAIIEQHDGHVGLDSAPGQGSTFWFTLPLMACPLDLARG